MKFKKKVFSTIPRYATYIGNGLSMFGLAATIVVYFHDIIKYFYIYIIKMAIKENFTFNCILRKLKNKSYSSQRSLKFMFDYYTEILLSLSISLLSMNIAYIVFSLVTWNTQPIVCTLFGVLLHYFLLSSFCWMLCLGILQYLMFNRVLLVINKYYLKVSLFSIRKIFYYLNYFTPPSIKKKLLFIPN